MHVSGTGTLVVGTAYFGKQPSHSKTNNGVGSAYGDGSVIEMMPYQSQICDCDLVDNPAEFKVPKSAPIFEARSLFKEGEQNERRF